MLIVVSAQKGSKPQFKKVTPFWQTISFLGNLNGYFSILFTRGKFGFQYALLNRDRPQIEVFSPFIWNLGLDMIEM